MIKNKTKVNSIFSVAELGRGLERMLANAEKENEKLILVD